jgi:hypothetical protein
MIDLTVEIPLTLREASRLPQLRKNGRRPHIASVYRWVTSGCRGVVLESAVVGGSRVTTSESIDRWIAALTAETKPHSQVRTPARRRRDHNRADADLAQAGW